MFMVALKMLVGDRAKYIALVAGIAFAALLITQQASIFAGFARRAGSWIRGVNYPDIWVTDQTMEFSDDLKHMSDMKLHRVRGVQGVAWAVPMFKGIIQARLPDGTQKTVRLLGIDDATLVGGPPEFVKGDLGSLRQDAAILVNEADLVKDLSLPREPGDRKLDIGDRIVLNDNQARIVGIYRAPKEFFWGSLIYTTYSRALTWAPKERNRLTYVLAKAAPGESPVAVARRIEAQTGLLARTNDEFDHATIMWMINNTGILPNFGITIALGFVIGALVAGQTFYSFVLDNLRSFAVLKAMGLSNRRVLVMLVLQVVIVGSVGYGIGLGLTTVAGYFMRDSEVAFHMPWAIPVFGAVGVLVCCMLAGVLGMVRVLRVEPAVVFKN